MEATAHEFGRGGNALEFLVVDEFLRTIVDARALKTAFELGLIDYLIEYGTGTQAMLRRTLGIDQQGLSFLLDLLRANHVITLRGKDVYLNERFSVALRYRDLLEIKLDFAGVILNDFADLFTALIKEPGDFAGKSRIFELFDYRRTAQPTIENYQRTRSWMRLTSTLTRYEALACMQLHDFGGYSRMLDIGGNSGEFLLQLCRRYPNLSGTVFDRPLVCEIGMEHLLPEPEHSRIGFITGDIRKDPAPAGYDLITFKSMLHDWPQESADAFLARAAAGLEPGGSILIFERASIRVGQNAPAFSALPMLLFFRSYREPAVYADTLRTLGFIDIVSRDIELDTPFMLITARKPHA